MSATSIGTTKSDCNIHAHVTAEPVIVFSMPRCVVYETLAWTLVFAPEMLAVAWQWLSTLCGLFVSPATGLARGLDFITPTGATFMV